MAIIAVLPKAHTAIAQAAEPAGSLLIARDIPLPEIRPGDILVKTAAVALNPCDFKTPRAFPTPGCYDGCDFAGTVVALGSEVAANGSWKIGDRVFGAVNGSNPADLDTGSYAHYIKSIGAFTYKMPDWMTFEQAAGLSPCCIATAGIALFKSLELPGTFEEPVPEGKGVDVLIGGGNSTVGRLCIQMVKLLGHRALSTCSPAAFPHVKSYGADHAFDYKSPTWPADVKKATRNCLKYVVDPFAEVRTMSASFEAIGRAGGRYTALERFQEDICNKKTVKRELVMGASILGFGIDLGKESPYAKPESAELKAWGKEWYRSVQRLVDEKRLRGGPVRVLNDEMQEEPFELILKGLEMLKRKGVFGEKLVVRFS